MANTYTQLHVQFVFAVKYRAALLHKSWRQDLFRYMTTIIQEKGHKVLQINGVEDHVHILTGIRPDQAVAELMKEVKACSSNWINQQGLCNGKFAWQGGYGAFSYSKGHVDRVIRYIQNQEAHHQRETFPDEYRRYMAYLGIEYKEEYIFTDPE